MVFEPTIDAERRQVSMLQEIIRAKHQRRRPGQLIGAHALGKVLAMKAGLANAR